MNMKTTIRDIMQAVPALEKLAGASLPLKTAYKLSKNIKLLQNEIDFFTREREKIMKEYGGEVKHSRIVFKKPEGLKALEDVLALEVEPECDKIEIVLSDNIRLAANDVTFLEPFVEFVEVDDG